MIALETVWIPSDGGAFLSFALGLLPTIVLLVVSGVRLVGLFGNQVRLDTLIRDSIENSYVRRHRIDQKTFSNSDKQIEEIRRYFAPIRHANSNQSTIEVFPQNPNCVISGYKIKNFEQAVQLLRFDSSRLENRSTSIDSSHQEISLEFLLTPGRRAKSGDPIIQIRMNQAARPEATQRATRILESSVIYEPESYVTAEEFTDRDLTQLKDTISQSLRAGQYTLAKHALQLVGQLLTGIWRASLTGAASTGSVTTLGRSALDRIMRDVELDVTLSARAADLLIDNAMERALAAPNSRSTEYIDDSLRSFVRMWSYLLQTRDPQFDGTLYRIVICVQNLTQFTYWKSPEELQLQARGSWTIVELIKVALDSQKIQNAVVAAKELTKFAKNYRDKGLASHAIAGQLVLLSWIENIKSEFSEEDKVLEPLKEALLISTTKSGLLYSYKLLQDGPRPVSRWEYWERSRMPSSGVHTILFPGVVKSELFALLCQAPGALPEISKLDEASLYKFFLAESDKLPKPKGRNIELLVESLEKELLAWDRQQNQLLLDEPIQDSRLDELKNAFIEHYVTNSSLPSFFTRISSEQDSAVDTERRLGNNILVPKIYLVQPGFNDIYADAADLGQTFAAGFINAEEKAILDKLRELTTDSRSATTDSLATELEKLGDQRGDFLLIIPFGGIGHYEDWENPSLQNLLKDIRTIESSSIPEDEAILVDPNSSIELLKSPDLLDGLNEMLGTEIAIGIFDDVQASDEEPQVRIQLAEKFDLLPGTAPTVYWFQCDENP